MTPREIAARAHAGQFRRDGVTPYILHPMKVASFFPSFSMRDDAAWLHDVLEDTYWTSEMLRDVGIAEEVIIAVELLTNRPKTNYEAFIQNIVNSGNPIAIDVKIADLLANLSDQPKKFQLIRYGKALTKLAPFSTFWT